MEQATNNPVFKSLLAGSNSFAETIQCSHLGRYTGSEFANNIIAKHDFASECIYPLHALVFRMFDNGENETGAIFNREGKNNNVTQPSIRGAHKRAFFNARTGKYTLGNTTSTAKHSAMLFPHKPQTNNVNSAQGTKVSSVTGPDMIVQRKPLVDSANKASKVPAVITRETSRFGVSHDSGRERNLPTVSTAASSTKHSAMLFPHKPQTNNINSAQGTKVSLVTSPGMIVQRKPLASKVYDASMTVSMINGTRDRMTNVKSPFGGGTNQARTERDGLAERTSASAPTPVFKTMLASKVPVDSGMTVSGQNERYTLSKRWVGIQSEEAAISRTSIPTTEPVFISRPDSGFIPDSILPGKLVKQHVVPEKLPILSFVATPFMFQPLLMNRLPHQISKQAFSRQENSSFSLNLPGIVASRESMVRHEPLVNNISGARVVRLNQYISPSTSVTSQSVETNSRSVDPASYTSQSFLSLNQPTDTKYLVRKLERDYVGEAMKQPGLTLISNEKPQRKIPDTELTLHTHRQDHLSANEPVLEVSQSQPDHHPSSLKLDANVMQDSTTTTHLSTEALADRIFRILERRLVVEQERRGIRL